MTPRIRRGTCYRSIRRLLGDVVITVGRCVGHNASLVALQVGPAVWTVPRSADLTPVAADAFMTHVVVPAGYFDALLADECEARGLWGVGR